MARKTVRIKITSDELITKINPKNKKLVERFMRNFDTKRSDSSVKAYTSNFNIFFCWNIVNNENKFFIDIKKSEFLDFFDYAVQELKWGSARYSQMWSTLSSLSNYIENILDDDYPNFRNNIKKLEKLPKAPVREKSVFSKEELDSLAQYLKENNKIQQLCLLKLLMASGVRISETLRFTTDIIDINNTAFDDIFIETTKEIATKGRGKQGKQLYKYLIKDLFVDDYLLWLEKRKEIMTKNNQDHNFVFIKPDGSPAKLPTLRSWILGWDKYLSKNFYPHAVRHYWTTYLSKLGLETDLLQELQGWASSEMVKIYNDQTAKDRKWKGLDKLKEALENI